MANKNYLDTAKQLREGVSALLARINVAQSSVTDLLAQVKEAEKTLLEKEEQERRERLERERQERLRSVLASDKDLAVHVGGVDEPEEEGPAASEPPADEATPAANRPDTVVAEEAPAAPDSTPPRVATAAEARVPAEQPAPATEPEIERKPVERHSGYEAHVIEPSAGAPSRRTQQPSSGYQRPAQQGGYQQRPAQQGGYQQRSAQQGGYQQRPAQQGGYQQRPAQQGGNRRAAATAVPGGKERSGGFDSNRSAYQRNYDTWATAR